MKVEIQRDTLTLTLDTKTLDAHSAVSDEVEAVRLALSRVADVIDHEIKRAKKG